jgi:hypothetical protein
MRIKALLVIVLVAGCGGDSEPPAWGVGANDSCKKCQYAYGTIQPASSLITSNRANL